MERKSQDNIPTSKVQRAAKFAKTGVKLGANYVKHYAKKTINPNLSRQELDDANASDVYETLSELKGSALKVAQMMSMSEGMLPNAYSEKFKMAQYTAPPLSFPLVVKTFRQYLGKSPNDIFDDFTKDAINAASIGQVHKAKIGDKTFAVKIQYPGVAESIDSDLRMVKPFAMQILGLSERDLEIYMKEVGDMLKSETNYNLELERSQKLAKLTQEAVPNAIFPEYYPEYSSERILTMDFLEGMHLKEFLATNPSQEIKNKVAQTLWDFYDYQMHILKEVHADPHPGNFLMKEDGRVGFIDFGAVKVIPEEYYLQHFSIMEKNILEDDAQLETAFEGLGFLMDDDTPQQRAFFKGVFKELLSLSMKPFHSDTFYFGDKKYFNDLNEFGERLSKMPELRNSKQARGSQHSLYLNRTYFGLYFLLHELNATVNTDSYWYKNKKA
ncbi:ABC1 kinase family protein [Bernardetia sp. OM2101]|uniref:ABC1 kinase family protein n=1 Tax=Bernardetia sp. OM2101 TaxID=3344876 RepID=UPI0035CF6DD2